MVISNARPHGRRHQCSRHEQDSTCMGCSVSFEELWSLYSASELFPAHMALLAEGKALAWMAVRVWVGGAGVGGMHWKSISQ
jgi:hypothetical protein